MTEKADGIRGYGPGKFDTIVDSYVYDVSLSGCDEETGSVDETGRWYGLIRGHILPDPGESPLTGTALNDAETALLARSAGAILSEDSQGFVSVEYFTDMAKLDREWAAIEAEVEWMHKAD